MVANKHSCSKWSEQAPAASTWGIGPWGAALRRVRFWSSPRNAGALKARQNLEWNRTKQKTDHAGMPFSHREKIINHHCEEEEVRDGFTEEVAFGQGLKGKTWKWQVGSQEGEGHSMHLRPQWAEHLWLQVTGAVAHGCARKGGRILVWKHR